MSQLHLLRWSFVVGKASFGSLLDEVLPGYDFNEVHRTVVPTDPARAYEALKAVSVGEIRLLEPLIGVRRLPALIRHGRFERNERSTAALDEFVRAGFLVLAERPPDKFVFGAVGRFWSLTSNQPLRSVRTREDFIAFAEPAKVAERRDPAKLAASDPPAPGAC